MTSSIKFSANLGFLWKERSLTQAIQAAASAGFDAVECHWPYNVDSNDVKSVLAEISLPMLGLNTRVGDDQYGAMGLAAISACRDQAKLDIDEAINYAVAIDCQNIHVMAGRNDSYSTSEETYQENLRYACAVAEKFNKTILIEPLNTIDAPGYHLSTLDQAIATVEAVAQPNLKIMFDCYHMQIMHGNLLARFSVAKEYIGHVQIAAVHDRGEPDAGEVDYSWLLRACYDAGYDGFVGAEYRPRVSTDSGVDWLMRMRKVL